MAPLRTEMAFSKQDGLVYLAVDGGVMAAAQVESYECSAIEKVLGSTVTSRKRILNAILAWLRLWISPRRHPHLALR